MKYALIAVLLIAGCHSWGPQFKTVEHPAVKEVGGCSITSTGDGNVNVPSNAGNITVAIGDVDESMLPTRKERLAACEKKILDDENPNAHLSPFCQGVAWGYAEAYLRERKHP